MSFSGIHGAPRLASMSPGRTSSGCTWRSRSALRSYAGPAYARNAERLRHVQPEDVLPGDIDANLGAPWIPESDVQAFAAALFHVEPSSIQVGHLEKEAA